MKNILCFIPLREERHRQQIAKAVEGFGGYRLLFVTPQDAADEDLSQAEIILGNPSPALLKKASSLKWLQLHSAGADAYVKEGVLPAETLLTNCAGAYGTSVSEHMLAVTFALIRHLPEYGRDQVEHRWQVGAPVISIEGSTIAVLGLGDIGGRYAKKVKALGAVTLGVRRTLKEKPDYIDEQFTIDQLDQVLPRADIVAMVLPGGEATERIMDERRLRLMKKGSYLINDGRGNAIDFQALKAVLDEGLLAGAALDVTDPEPLPADDPLWDYRNVLLTPHIAGGFLLPRTVDQIADIVSSNLSSYLKGEPLRHLVSREMGY